MATVLQLPYRYIALRFKNEHEVLFVYNNNSKRIVAASVRKAIGENIGDRVHTYLTNGYKETERGVLKRGEDYESLQAMRALHRKKL